MRAAKKRIRKLENKLAMTMRSRRVVEDTVADWKRADLAMLIAMMRRLADDFDVEKPR